MRGGCTLLAAIWLLTGCLVDADFGGSGFLCEQSEVCPDNHECRAGVCQPIRNFTGFRHTLTFDNGSGTEDLVDFPVMVRLDGSRVEYREMQTDGEDVRFEAVDGTPLVHDVERFDATGQSTLWVQVPLIPAGSTDTTIYIVYGDPEAQGTAQPEAVWANYQALYHLGDDVNDSTVQSIDGTNVGTTVTRGVAGNARFFGGTDEHIDLGTEQPFMQAQSAFTVSAWVKPDPLLVTQGLVFGASIQDVNLGDQSRATVTVEADRGVAGGARSIDGGSLVTTTTGNNPAVDDQWLWIAFVVDLTADTQRLYIDGQLATELLAAGHMPVMPDTPSTQSSIGIEEDLAGDDFHGAIDELRVSHDAKTGAWLDAQHRSMTDQLIAFGVRETF
jgi:hypothetical protein